jgi:1,4-dihydroxy-2-naphthoate octaprenyltransferase
MEASRHALLKQIAQEAVDTPAWRRRVLAREAASRWLRAVRLQFYPMTLLAFAVGALSAAHGSDTNLGCFALTYAALFSIEVASVFANEIGDRGTDQANRNFGPFTGGSRVLVNADLSLRQMKTGMVWSAAIGACFAAAAVVHGLNVYDLPMPLKSSQRPAFSQAVATGSRSR